MPLDDQTTFEISTGGEVPQTMIDRAVERLERVGRHCREPIPHVELRVTVEPNRRHSRPYRAEATFDTDRGRVRAHAQAPSINEAVDSMIDRLRARVDRHASRLHQTGLKHHDGVATPGSWRHGDVDATPRHPTPTHEPGAIVRRKSFAATPMTVEDALTDLETLDHDFFLFREATSGETALVSRTGEQGYRLDIATDHEPDIHPDFPVEVGTPAAVLDEASAQRLLDLKTDPFVFHRPDIDAPGQVMYRRYDGDYGVIELARAGGPNS